MACLDQSQRLQSLFPSLSDWHVKGEQSRVRGQQWRIFDWLSVLLHYTAARGPHWMCSTLPNPLPPQWGLLCLHLTCFKSAFYPFDYLLHFISAFPSLYLYWYDEYQCGSRQPFNTAAERDTVIKLNGLNISLCGIFIKPIHKGRLGVTQLGDLNTNISD